MTKEELNIERQIKKLVVINTVSSSIALCCAVVGLILNILLRVNDLSANGVLVFILAIFLCVLGAISVVGMFITWYKLRNIKKQLPADDEIYKEEK